MKKLLALLAISAISFFLIWKLNFFTVNNVEVVSNAECVDSENLKQEVNLLGQNLIFLDTKIIEDRIKSRYLCVKNVEIKYEFPKTILITCFGRTFLSKITVLKPLSLNTAEASVSSQTALVDTSFPASSNEAMLIIDDTGYIFKKDEGELLPLIFFDKDIVLGEQLNYELFQKITLIFKTLSVKLYGFEIKNVRLKLSQDNIIVNDSFIIVFDTKKDILKQLASLQLILQEAKINQRALKSVDLRFDKAIVTY